MSTSRERLSDDAVGTVQIGGSTVRRLGFGTMRLPDTVAREGREAGASLVREAVDRGVNFIDTANIYGRGLSEELIAHALFPYSDEVLIASKAGFSMIPRDSPDGQFDGRPESIIRECESSLRRLRRDVIDLYQVHVPDPSVAYEETVGAFHLLQEQGKVRYIGVSNVGRRQLERARSVATIVSVQNRFNPGDTSSNAVLAECERLGIPFIPWQPVKVDGAGAQRVLQGIASKRSVTPPQVGLAWLLRRSAMMLPIPGTSTASHLHENISAAFVSLTDPELAEITSAVL